MAHSHLEPILGLKMVTSGPMASLKADRIGKRFTSSVAPRGLFSTMSSNGSSSLASVGSMTGPVFFIQDTRSLPLPTNRVPALKLQATRMLQCIFTPSAHHRVPMFSSTTGPIFPNGCFRSQSLTMVITHFFTLRMVACP